LIFAFIRRRPRHYATIFFAAAIGLCRSEPPAAFAADYFFFSRELNIAATSSPLQLSFSPDHAAADAAFTLLHTTAVTPFASLHRLRFSFAAFATISPFRHFDESTASTTSPSSSPVYSPAFQPSQQKKEHSLAQAAVW
jgi:hypothetical protein